jgi:hypothetical protein
LLPEIATTSFSLFPVHWKFPSRQCGTGFGVAYVVQLVPFQRAAYVALFDADPPTPTAQTSLAVRADTALKMFPYTFGLGLATTVQLVKPPAPATNATSNAEATAAPTRIRLIRLLRILHPQSTPRSNGNAAE